MIAGARCEFCQKKLQFLFLAQDVLVRSSGHLEELFWSGALAEIRSYGPVDQPITTNQMTDRQQYGQYTGMERRRGRGSMSNVEPLNITCCLHQRNKGFIRR